MHVIVNSALCLRTLLCLRIYYVRLDREDGPFGGYYKEPFSLFIHLVLGDESELGYVPGKSTQDRHQ